MLKDIEKYKWLVTHDFEVAKLAECDQVTWQAWDTLDFDGYRIVTPTKKEAINEAFKFLNESL